MTTDFTLVLIGHALSVASFGALFVLVAIGRKPSPYRGSILLAAAGTCFWGAATIGVSFLVEQPVIVPLVEWVSIAGWLWLTVQLLQSAAPERTRAYRRLAVLGLGLPFAVIALLTGLSVGGVNPLGAPATNLLEAIALICMIVFGLALVETLARWMSARGRTAAIYFFFAVGALLAIDLFLYATMLLLGRIDGAIYEARGLLSAFAPPLIAVALARQRDWLVDIHVSRQVIVNAATLFGAGIYLLAMAVAGFAVREMNSAWGPMLHVTFLFGAIVLLASILSLEGLRPKLNVWISRNFFSAKYDYRREWLRFSEALSVGPGNSAVEDRLLDAILQSLGCRSGGLWLCRDGDGEFALAAARPSSLLLSDAPVQSLVAALEASHGPVVLNPQSPAYGELAKLGSLRQPWAGVPLRHRARLVGFLVLAEPLASRQPDGEDCELLQVLSAQAAGHLAEERSASALGRTQRFEATARRLTYIGHDLKNIVSQLSLVLQNWSRHGDNPIFLNELPKVLGGAVVRMKNLLGGLKAGAEGSQGESALVDLNDCLNPLLALWRARYARIAVELDGATFFVRGPFDHIQSIFDQLVSNAIEASDGTRDIKVSTKLNGDTLVCEITDAGKGINEKSVSDSRFSVIDSPKASGFGVGLFQVRDYVGRLGGSLSFASEPGIGTTAKFTLPVEFPPAGSPRVRLAATRPAPIQAGANQKVGTLR